MPNPNNQKILQEAQQNVLERFGKESYHRDTVELCKIELELQNEELQMQIQELTLAQEKLKFSHDYYFNLYHHLPLGCVYLDRQGMIVEANATLAQVLNFKARDFLQQPLSNFIAPADQDIFYLHYKKFLRTKTSSSCEICFLRRLETPLRLELLLSCPSQLLEGGAEFFYGIVREIKA